MTVLLARARKRDNVMKILSFMATLVYTATLQFPVLAQQYPSPTFNTATANSQTNSKIVGAYPLPTIPCDVSAYSYYLTTKSAVPSCFANLSTYDVEGLDSIKFPPVTGVAVGHLVRTQHLVQANTTQGNGIQEYGSAINMQVGTGAGVQTNWNQKVGEFIGVNVVPGGSNAWAFNTDITQHAGVGNYPMFGYENDISNFNQEFPVGGTVSAGIFQQFLSSNRVTAAYYAAATTSAGTGNPGAFAAYDGFLLNGANLFSDNDWISSTGAKFGFQLAGTHITGFDTTNDTLSTALNAKQGQYICLNSSDGCLQYTGSNTLWYKQNGGVVAALQGANSGVNYPTIKNNSAGFGPAISASGADINISLDLQGKGAAAVRALGPGGFTTTAGPITSNDGFVAGSQVGVSCAAGTVNLSTMVVTNGIITHC